MSGSSALSSSVTGRMNIEVPASGSRWHVSKSLKDAG